jgi:hypothetical protein
MPCDPPGALEVNGKVRDDSDAGKAGVDFLSENCIVVVDRNGNNQAFLVGKPVYSAWK